MNKSKNWWKKAFYKIVNWCGLTNGHDFFNLILLAKLIDVVRDTSLDSLLRLSYLFLTAMITLSRS